MSRLTPITSPGPSGGDVDQPAAGHDLRHRLGAEPLDPVGARELGDAPAVVAAVADLQVAQRVEVRAELLVPAICSVIQLTRFAPRPPPFAWWAVVTSVWRK